MPIEKYVNSNRDLCFWLYTMHNKVNIEFLTKQMNKVLVDIEKLKDKQRTFSNGDQ